LVRHEVAEHAADVLNDVGSEEAIFFLDGLIGCAMLAAG